MASPSGLLFLPRLDMLEGAELYADVVLDEVEKLVLLESLSEELESSVSLLGSGGGAGVGLGGLGSGADGWLPSCSLVLVWRSDLSPKLGLFSS